MVASGHRGDEATARRALADAEPAVRAAAVGALARMGRLGAADVARALGDPDPAVRRRALVEAPAVRGPGSRSVLPGALRQALDDADPLVVEAACWALGERRVAAAVGRLGAVAASHPDPRCREGAVAALGAIGDPAGLEAVLGALGDRPAVRRRATVALAAFSGGTVEEALGRMAADRDWQVRQVAEILLGLPPSAGPPAGAGGHAGRVD